MTPLTPIDSDLKSPSLPWEEFPTQHLRVVHSLPGRVRIHFPHWREAGPQQIHEQFQRLPGVYEVKASAWTQNVLFLYNRQQISEQGLLEQLQGIRTSKVPLAAPAEALANGHGQALTQSPAGKARRRRPPAVVEGKGKHRRARISVHGMTRDPRLCKHLVHKLEEEFQVKVRPNVLTGRIIVDYDHNIVQLEEVLTMVGELEMPPLVGEDQPTHPLSSEPLWESAIRMIGSMIGLGVVTIQQLFFPAAPALIYESTAATVAAGAHLVHGAPFAHHGVRRVLGSTGARVFNSGVSLAALALAGLPLGLIVVGVEAGLMLREVLARRAAFRRYEDSLDHTISQTPGHMIRLEPGMVVPAPGRILEGAGSLITHSGKQIMLQPGDLAPSGGTVFGGPFLLELEGSHPFTPVPRSVAPSLTLSDYYLRAAVPVSIVTAAVAGLVTGSFHRFAETVMLLSPLVAIVGRGTSNLIATSRALRNGATIIHSRHDRLLRRADVVLLDGPRLLTDGLEIDQVIPLRSGMDRAEILPLAAAVAEATNNPWGQIFHGISHPQVQDGNFDGRHASAHIDCVLYQIQAVPENDDLILMGKELLHSDDQMILVLTREDDRGALGTDHDPATVESRPGFPGGDLQTSACATGRAARRRSAGGPCPGHALERPAAVQQRCRALHSRHAGAGQRGGVCFRPGRGWAGLRGLRPGHRCVARANLVFPGPGRPARAGPDGSGRPARNRRPARPGRCGFGRHLGRRQRRRGGLALPSPAGDRPGDRAPLSGRPGDDGGRVVAAPRRESSRGGPGVPARPQARTLGPTEDRRRFEGIPHEHARTPRCRCPQPPCADGQHSPQ